MSRVEGGCLCGAVRYAIEAEPVVTAVCHCKHCQRQSGSAFSILVALPKGGVQYAGRPLAQYQDMGETGLPMLRKFCPNCGSAVVSEPAATPALEWIKAGTLDDTSWLHPTISIWCDHAQPWVTLDDSIQKVPRNPPFGA